MNKKTKMIVGVGVVALAAYLLYQQSQKKTASFSGGVGSPRMRNSNGPIPEKGISIPKSALLDVGDPYNQSSILGPFLPYSGSFPSSDNDDGGNTKGGDYGDYYESAS